MFHDILVAVDGSAHADQALTHAIDLAESEHTRLTLIAAAAELPATTYLAAGELTSKLIEDARAEAEEILRRARERVPDDLPVTTVLTDQPIRIAVISQIKDGHHDLVVMGSRRPRNPARQRQPLRPAPQPRPGSHRPRRAIPRDPNH
jgi:nucleotide-binding universal stress UspA family protein